VLPVRLGETNNRIESVTETVDAEGMKCKLLSCDIKIANRSSENVAHFTYLEMALINQNLTQENIKRQFW
jgi:hypothetical protein